MGSGYRTDRIIPVTQEVADLSDVEASLSELYARALGEATASAPTVRTTLFNLVSYSRTPEASREAESAVSRISGSHPCRIIALDAFPPRPGEPETAVSIICGITERGDRRLCGEIIHLHLHDDGTAALGTVMPLLLPDLPVYLWLLGDIPEDCPRFDAVVDAADSVVVDSRSFTDLTGGLRRAAGLVRPHPALRSIRDLAWVSLHWWRELTAQHFDPPVARPYAASVSQISLEYSPDDEQTPVPAVALLFASWLISRFDIVVDRPATQQKDTVLMEGRQGDHEAVVRFKPGLPGLEPGQLLSVRIECSGGTDLARAGEPAVFITRTVSDTQLSITEECSGLCFPPRVVDMGVQDVPALLSQALDLPRRYAVFEDSFHCALSLLNLLER